MAKWSEFEKDEALRRRQLTFGVTMEELELILHPMVEDAKEATGSMGDDTPLAVLSSRYRGLHHFFRQNFSQVTNPPIDSLRERRVMTKKTRLGNLGNILDEDESQCRVLQLDSPVLSNAEFEAMRRLHGPDRGRHRLHLRSGRRRQRPQGSARPGPARGRNRGSRRLRARHPDRQADRFRPGAAAHDPGDRRRSTPIIVAQKLRTFVSLNVRSGECLDVHYFAVLIGAGATTVNAYLAQESIAERQRRGLFGGHEPRGGCVRRYNTAVGDGLLKVMSKMGISVLSSYRGGYNFEAVGLSRTLVDEYFTAMPSRISGIGLTGIQQKVLELHEPGLAPRPTRDPAGRRLLSLPPRRRGAMPGAPA